jgi:hypothetical protein
MAIAKELGQISPELEVRFASYATGAETFRRAGQPVIDMALPELNPFLPTMLLATALIERLAPDVVVAHEEFAALPAAHLCQRPGVFVSAWLPFANDILSDSLAYADAAIILEEPGIFPRPSTMQIDPEFVGPILRPMKYSPADRLRARKELSLPPGATVIAVIPGGFATEERAPIAGIVNSAWQSLPGEKRLIWLAGKDQATLRTEFAAHVDVSIMEYCQCIEQVIVASDLVVTKGTRGTSLDAAALNVPTLSLSFGLNPIDDLLVPRMRSNLSLIGPAVSGATLARYICEILSDPSPYRQVSRHNKPDGARRAAQAIASATARVLN